MINNDGLDFETDDSDESQNPPAAPSPQKHPGLKDISRHAFRLPIQKIGSIKVSIANHTLDLVNIVINETAGIGVRPPRKDTFAKDQKISIIRFKLFDQDFSFQGKVQHISPDVAGHYLCGIMLTRLTDEEKTILKILVQRLHSELFR
jgi:hypothetical protein